MQAQEFFCACFPGKVVVVIFSGPSIFAHFSTSTVSGCLRVFCVAVASEADERSEPVLTVCMHGEEAKI